MKSLMDFIYKKKNIMVEEKEFMQLPAQKDMKLKNPKEISKR
jgi:hypothetical protein